MFWKTNTLFLISWNRLDHNTKWFPEHHFIFIFVHWFPRAWVDWRCFSRNIVPFPYTDICCSLSNMLSGGYHRVGDAAPEDSGHQEAEETWAIIDRGMGTTLQHYQHQVKARAVCNAEMLCWSLLSTWCREPPGGVTTGPVTRDLHRTAPGESRKTCRAPLPCFHPAVKISKRSSLQNWINIQFIPRSIMKYP